MKTCADCKVDLPLENFALNKRKPDGLSDKCRPCKKTYNRFYYKRTKQKHNPGRALARQTAVAFNQQNMLSILSNSFCMDCGINDVRVLEFDHVTGKKLGNISDLMSGKWSKVLEEIKKCEIVCANCHRIRTSTRKPSYRSKHHGSNA